MKALLKYNGFTRMIDIPEIRPEIRIPVIETLRVMVLPKELEPKEGDGYWRFIYRENMTEDIAIYEFEEAK